MCIRDRPYPVQIKVWLQDGMLMGEIRSNEALKERYRLKEENHHYTKETYGYYRNSFVYQVLSDSDGKELQKNLILQNYCKALFDPALIPHCLLYTSWKMSATVRKEQKGIIMFTSWMKPTRSLRWVPVVFPN